MYLIKFQAAETTLSTAQACVTPKQPRAQSVTYKALVKVAKSIPDKRTCLSLAAELKFSAVDLPKVNDFQEMTTPHEILADWVRRDGENATGQALYDALVESDMKLIADKCEHHLLGKTVWYSK